jgi:hypothetical protein
LSVKTPAGKRSNCVKGAKKAERGDNNDNEGNEEDDGKPKMSSKNAGKKHIRWSQGQLDVWDCILYLPVANLPSSALRQLTNELESNSTAVAVDIRKCAFPMSIEETLAVIHAMACAMECLLIVHLVLPALLGLA